MEVVITLVGVAVGFILAIGWDTWKTNHDRAAELGRALYGIKLETETNISLISEDLKLLHADDAAADKAQEIIEPLEQLESAVGDAAYINGSLALKSGDFSINVRKIYVQIGLLNKRIEGREMYRMTNGAMTNFGMRRKMWNHDLRDMMTALQSKLQALSSELDSQ